MIFFVKEFDKEEVLVHPAFMQVSIDQAKAFCSVVSQGGYTKAALHLNKSHSALIYLIKSLEEQCGFSLFDRNGYRNTLTPAGEQVHQKCSEILSKVDELQGLCGLYQKGWEASLKIVCDGIFPFDPFLQIYKKFKTENIPTVVQTYTDYLEDVESSYKKLNADLMISVTPIKEKGLHSIPLKSFKTLLVAHKDHPLHQTKRRWKKEELLNFYFLTIRGATHQLGLQTEEFEKTASFYLSDFYIKKEALLKKIGFGWLPQHLIEHELKHKTLLTIKWDGDSNRKIQPHLYSPSPKNMGQATRLIVDFLTDL